jgi:hypothetical protein
MINNKQICFVSVVSKLLYLIFTGAIYYTVTQGKDFIFYFSLIMTSLFFMIDIKMIYSIGNLLDRSQKLSKDILISWRKSLDEWRQTK